jgi:hypothetical protein
VTGPRETRRARRRRRLGAGLLAFGVTGLALVAAAGALVLGSLSAVNDAATGFEKQRVEIVAMLGPAASALSHAATSASNAGASLTETSAAASQAAQLTTRLADSFEGLAALGSFEILGSRPFGGLSGQFTEVGVQARVLSTNLTTAAVAMNTNIADSQAVAADLRSLADQLERLRTSLATPGGASPAPSAALPIDAARIVLVGLLAWLAVPAIASLWLGWRLIRPAGGRKRATRGTS